MSNKAFEKSVSYELIDKLITQVKGLDQVKLQNGLHKEVIVARGILKEAQDAIQEFKKDLIERVKIRKALPKEERAELSKKEKGEEEAPEAPVAKK
jgi:hypothetical protein